MDTNTQKTWTLQLTPADGSQTTVTGISQDELKTLLWEHVHGFGSLEALASRGDGEHEQPLAA